MKARSGVALDETEVRRHRGVRTRDLGRRRARRTELPQIALDLRGRFRELGAATNSIPMGNILVLFHSKSGNTAKMAAEVAAGAARIPGMEVRLRTVAEATAEDVRWCHGIAVGSPVNMGLVAWEMKQFWDTKMPDDWSKLDGRIGCAFSSQGGWGGGAEITCQSIHTILVNFGFLVFGLPDYVAHQFNVHYGATISGEPREPREIEACRRLGQRLAEWVAVYVDGRKEEHPLTSGRTRFPW